MAATSLLALIDDIATVLDDVAAMTKVAAQKTAGVLGDDLALNAQQVTGLSPERELPVVWAVAKGSLVNKAILVPGALFISAVAHWLVMPLLMVGGAYLCFEGAEKLAHRFLHSKEEDEKDRTETLAAAANEEVDLVAFEREKIKGAVRTDFVLSAEIVVIALGVFDGDSFLKQVLALSLVALAMTVFVYGLVAGIVKLDDLGLALSRRPGPLKPLGLLLLKSVPWLMRSLGVLGTAAMFLVGGGILAHGIGPVHHFAEALGKEPGLAAAAGVQAVNAATGVAAGLALVALVAVGKRLLPRKAGGTPA